MEFSGYPWNKIEETFATCHSIFGSIINPQDRPLKPFLLRDMFRGHPSAMSMMNNKTCSVNSAVAQRLDVGLGSEHLYFSGTGSECAHWGRGDSGGVMQRGRMVAIGISQKSGETNRKPAPTTSLG